MEYTSYYILWLSFLRSFEKYEYHSKNTFEIRNSSIYDIHERLSIGYLVDFIDIYFARAVRGFMINSAGH